MYKLFAKSEKEQEMHIQTIRIYIQDIEMEFSIEKFAMFIRKSGKKKETTEGIELLIQEKENYNYL